MSENSSDEAFAKYAQKTGMASGEQIEAARKLRTSLPTGVTFSLAEALVKQGTITAAQREAVEKKLEEEVVSQLGPYRLMRKIGEGGMGAVYLADDTGEHRKVALKVLPKKLARDAEFLKRFLREAEASTKLFHVNIVRGFAAGEDRGYHYYAMEYCPGESLKKRLEREGYVLHEEATGIVAQVARGLRYAHENSFIHRDIKPDNIMLVPPREAKILDLGLTKNLDETEKSFKTVTGQALGTPHYMSPEQARGEKTIDGRADIYSLGATFYHLLTGAAPFQGSSILEVISKSMVEPLPDPRDVRKEIPEGVVHVLRKMMAKTPEDRYRDCSDLLADLELIGAKKAPTSPGLAPGRSAIALPKATPRSGMKPRVGAAAAAVATLIVVLVVILFRHPSQKDGTGQGASEKAQGGNIAKTEGGPIDLLTHVDPARSVNGQWRLENNSLVSDNQGTNGSSSRLPVPFQPPAQYDLEIALERLEGNEDLLIGFVFDGRQATAFVDGFVQLPVGPSSGKFNNGGWIPEHHGRVINDNKPHTLVLAVREKEFSLSVDGTRIVQGSSGDSLGIASGNRISDQPGLLIGSVRTVWRITRLSLRETGGKR